MPMTKIIATFLLLMPPLVVCAGIGAATLTLYRIRNGDLRRVALRRSLADIGGVLTLALVLVAVLLPSRQDAPRRLELTPFLDVWRRSVDLPHRAKALFEAGA